MKESDVARGGEHDERLVATGGHQNRVCSAQSMIGLASVLKCRSNSEYETTLSPEARNNAISTAEFTD